MQGVPNPNSQASSLFMGKISQPFTRLILLQDPEESCYYHECSTDQHDDRSPQLKSCQKNTRSENELENTGAVLNSLVYPVKNRHR